MKTFNRNTAIAALAAAMALLSGCGGANSTVGTMSPQLPFGRTGGAGFNGDGQCYPITGAIPFTVNGAYLSGITMCTAGTSLNDPACTAGQATLGGTVTQGYFNDVGVDGVQSASFHVYPASQSWVPQFQSANVVYPTTGSASGVFRLGSLMQQELIRANGGQAPCVDAIGGFSTAFSPVSYLNQGGTYVYSTRITFRWRGTMGSGTDEAQF